jgi:hypothetical protein
MGMDPLDNKETLEVTIELNGPVNATKFKDFQTAINNFLTACAAIDNGVEAGKQLKVRVHRTGVRKKLEA